MARQKLYFKKGANFYQMIVSGVLNKETQKESIGYTIGQY